MPLPIPHRRARFVLSAVAAALVAVLIAGCAATTEMGPPKPTPADITGIADGLAQAGITIRNLVSGDAGCDDPDMISTAIGLDASGLDQATAVPVHLFIFRNAASYQKLRPAVDVCASSWITDPSGYEAIDASPFVLAGQGPWAPSFKTAVRDALTLAAGEG
jgi:hypothetical protein